MKPITALPYPFLTANSYLANKNTSTSVLTTQELFDDNIQVVIMDER
jgi:hypothetical protein